MFNTKAKSEIPKCRSHGRATRSHKRYNQKKRPSIRELPDRCRFEASFWTHSMRSIIIGMTSSVVSLTGRIEERRFGGFSTRFLSLVIRYHIKARSVNRLFCQFRAQSQGNRPPYSTRPILASSSGVWLPFRAPADFVKNFSNSGLSG
jgi:hypothetical protein